MCIRHLHFIAFFLLHLVATIPQSSAQAGTFDPDFGINGKATFSVNEFNNRSHAIAVQSDSKILLGGSVGAAQPNLDHLCLARLLPDGTPDISFGIGGKVITVLQIGTNFVYSAQILVQPDGKIIQVGGFSVGVSHKLFLVRYNTNGTLDNTFGSGGKKIIFGDTGDIGNVQFAQLQPDGKIVVSGSMNGTTSVQDVVVFRILPNGDLDNSFDGDGKVVTDLGTTNDVGNVLGLQTDGKIVVAGHKGETIFSNSYNFVLMRYNHDGSLDNTFGNGGIVIHSFTDDQDDPTALIVLPDGKILLTGFFQIPQGNYDFTLVRYNADGTLDTGFGNGGIIQYDLGSNNDPSTSLIRQPDGKILVAGTTNFAMVGTKFSIIRLNADYSLDSSFGINGVLQAGVGNDIEDEGYVRDITLQPDGKIVVSMDNAVDSSGKSVFCALRILTGLDVGVLDFSNLSNAVLIYPNPVQSEAVVQYTLEQDEYLTINLYTLNGQLIHTYLENEYGTQGSIGKFYP